MTTSLSVRFTPYDLYSVEKSQQVGWVTVPLAGGGVGWEITTFYFEHFDNVENSLICYPSFLKTCNKHPTLEKLQGKVSKLLVAAHPSGD